MLSTRSGLLDKIKNSILGLYAIIKSYLLYTTFIVKYVEPIMQLKDQLWWFLK